MNLLQGVIEKVTGILFEDYLRKNVWIPAAMMSTGFDLPERIVPHRAKGYLRSKGRIINNPYGDLSYKFASGGMISTVEDLVRFGMALNHVRLLQPETTAIMYQPQLKTVYRYQPNGPPVRENFEQGLIWRMQKDSGGRIFAYHCGTVKGFNACLVNYFGEDLVVAIADNMEVIGFRPALQFAEFFRAARQNQANYLSEVFLIVGNQSRLIIIFLDATVWLTSANVPDGGTSLVFPTTTLLLVTDADYERNSRLAYQQSINALSEDSQDNCGDI